jgi:hypothetical protein
VHKGQLSRFCRGDFKTVSNNLQLVIEKLQISRASYAPTSTDNIEMGQTELIDPEMTIWRRNAGIKRGAYVAAIRAIEQLVV